MRPENSVRAILNYTLDNGSVPEAYFYEPPAGTIVQNPGNDPQSLPIFDAWPHVERFSPDREGFALKEFRSDFDRFDKTIRCAANSIPLWRISFERRSAPVG
jgi:hypothetical protein